MKSCEGIQSLKVLGSHLWQEVPGGALLRDEAHTRPQGCGRGRWCEQSFLNLNLSRIPSQCTHDVWPTKNKNWNFQVKSIKRIPKVPRVPSYHSLLLKD
jgi:hypothetical protein